MTRRPFRVELVRRWAKWIVAVGAVWAAWVVYIYLSTDLWWHAVE